MVKRILVTGGMGYIGSHCVLELIDLGYEVIILDNTKLKKNLDSRAKLIKGDIRDLNLLDSIFKTKIDIVFHFAGLKAAGESMQNPMEYSDVNIRGTINLLNSMIKNNIKYFIFSSSAAVYGMPKYLPIDEKHPLNPENYYGFTKANIESILEWYSKLKGLRYASLRYFNAAGYDIKGKIRTIEKNPTNLFPIIMEVVTGKRSELEVFGNDYNTPDKTCIRDYIHVNDLITAHILAMDYLLEKNSNLIINLGTNKGYSVLEILKKVQEIINKPVNYKIVKRRKGDPDKLIASFNLANKLLGWNPKYSDLDTIINSMLKVYQSEDIEKKISL